MIFVLILNVLSFFFAKVVGKFLKRKNFVIRYNRQIEKLAVIILCLFFLQIFLNCVLHTYFVGKYSDVIFYACSFITLDFLIIGLKPIVSGQVVPVFVFLRHSVGVISFIWVAVFLYYFQTFFVPSCEARDEYLISWIFHKSDDINVFGKYYIVFYNSRYHSDDEARIYKRHLLLFKSLVMKHETGGYELADFDISESKNYKYTRKWEDTMFIGHRKLYYDERTLVKDVHTYESSNRVVYPMNTPAIAIAYRQSGMLIVRKNGKYCFSEGPAIYGPFVSIKHQRAGDEGVNQLIIDTTIKRTYDSPFYCTNE